MARRDVRRHKVRSALIAVMVGLPVLLLTAGTTLFATTQVSAVESIPRLMGSAAARVSVGDMDGAKQLAQAPEGGNVNTLSTPAILPPGRRAGAPWTPDDVGRVFGARAVPVIDSNGVARVGGHRIRASILGVDGRETLTRPMLALESGRWPAAAGEVLATPAGVALGLPASGTFALTLDSATGAKPADITVTVVGRATAQTIHGKVDLVTLPATVPTALPGQGAGFLVDRAAPVTWQDVRRLNTYGLTVASRAVYLQPPPRSEVDPSVYSMGVSNNGSTLVVPLLALGIFIETTLLAGPAFAVSAASQRHSLALAASNGAQARQLRRSVLGQALVLGILAAVASVALGIAAARAAIAAWTLHSRPSTPGRSRCPGLRCSPSSVARRWRPSSPRCYPRGVCRASTSPPC
jgi:putative ABC transport system permease protein